MIIKVQKQSGGLITDNEFLSIAEYQDGNGILRESTENGVLWMEFGTDKSQEEINSFCLMYGLNQVLE